MEDDHDFPRGSADVDPPIIAIPHQHPATQEPGKGINQEEIAAWMYISPQETLPIFPLFGLACRLQTCHLVQKRVFLLSRLAGLLMLSILSRLSRFSRLSRSSMWSRLCSLSSLSRLSMLSWLSRLSRLSMWSRLCRLSRLSRFYGCQGCQCGQGFVCCHGC